MTKYELRSANFLYSYFVTRTSYFIKAFVALKSSKGFIFFVEDLIGIRFFCTFNPIYSTKFLNIMSKENSIFKSSNPLLNEEVLAKSAREVRGLAGDHTMTVSGAVNKTLLLFSLMMVTTAISWAAPNKIFMFAGIIGGLVSAIAVSFKPQWSLVVAPIYALFEGLFIGTVSAMYANTFNGVVFNATVSTLGLLFLMLFLYKSGIITVTEKFRGGVIMATMGIGLLYLVSWVMSFFGMNIPFLHESSMMGIVLNVGIIGVATLNLLLDFDNFDEGERHGAPAYMEWNAAMGLLVTLVWLYIEILRLASKLSRD
jgi:uncharacterized YccA/Bax inhibitor family protein